MDLVVRQLSVFKSRRAIDLKESSKLIQIPAINNHFLIRGSFSAFHELLRVVSYNIFYFHGNVKSFFQFNGICTVLFLSLTE